MSKPAKKPHAAAALCEPGDHVFVEHPKRGAMAVKVLSKGADGFHGRAMDGSRHPLGWDAYRGHKARKLERYNVVDRGADGSLVEDEKGKRRFIAGELPGPPPPEPAPKVDDPLTGGLDRLSKAAIHGGALGDLFPAAVRVHGYTRAGTYVPPHVAKRLKRPVGAVPLLERVRDGSGVGSDRKAGAGLLPAEGHRAHAADAWASLAARCPAIGPAADALRRASLEGAWPAGFQSALASAVGAAPAGFHSWIATHWAQSAPIAYRASLDDVPERLRAVYESAAAVTVNHRRIEWWGDRLPTLETLLHETVHASWYGLSGVDRWGTMRGPAAGVIDAVVQDARTTGARAIALSCKKAMRGVRFTDIPGEPESDANARYKAWRGANEIRSRLRLYDKWHKEGVAMDRRLHDSLELSLAIPSFNLPYLIAAVGGTETGEQMSEVVIYQGLADRYGVKLSGPYAVEEVVAYRAGTDLDFADRLFGAAARPPASLSKAKSIMTLPDGPILLFKSATVANRPGLALQRVTDRAGHQTQRWKRTAPKPTPEKREPRLDPSKAEPQRRATPDVRANPADRWKTSDPKAPRAPASDKAEPKALLPAKGATLRPKETPEEAKAKFAGVRQQLAKDRADTRDHVERSTEAMRSVERGDKRSLHDQVMEGDVPEPKERSAESQAAEKPAPMDDAPTFKNNGVSKPIGQGGGVDRSDKGVMSEKDAAASFRDEAKKAPMKHGDTVSFRHGDVEGTGKIVASGKDGVTVHDGQREHQVRHDALQGPTAAKPDYAPRADGEEDKAYAKRVIDKMDHPGEMPEDHDRYFNNVEGAETVPMDKLVSSKSDEENAQGGANSPKRLAAAYHGVLSKRDPISVSKMDDGRYKIEDGNGTYTGAKGLGWKSLKVKIVPAGDVANAPPAETAKQLFDRKELEHLPENSVQPMNTEDELYKASGEALAHLKSWLDQGKGVCAQLGYETMKCAPEDADLTKPGGMLFIAPLKGKARAKEKVEGKYHGNWNKLKDVVRCSIAVDTMGDIADALEQLKASGMILANQPDDRFAKPTSVGYRDLAMNVKFPNGLIGEVQLHLKPILIAKGAGHKPYEIMRTLDVKPREQWTPEDEATYQSAVDQSKEIYESAWSKASGATGAPDEAMTKAMTKAMGMGEAWEFYKQDGARFRRPAGKPGGVTHILNEDTRAWEDYQGDRTEPYIYGTRIADPVGSGGDTGGGDQPMRKAMALLLKAQIKGGAIGDLLPMTVSVKGHTTKDGVTVAPHTATRKKHVAPVQKERKLPKQFRALEGHHLLDKPLSHTLDGQKSRVLGRVEHDGLTYKLGVHRTPDGYHGAHIIPSEGPRKGKRINLTSGHNARNTLRGMVDYLGSASIKDGAKFHPELDVPGNGETLKPQALPLPRKPIEQEAAEQLAAYEASKKAAVTPTAPDPGRVGTRAQFLDDAHLKRVEAVIAGYRALGDEKAAGIVERMLTGRIGTPILEEDVAGMERVLATKQAATQPTTQPTKQSAASPEVAAALRREAAKPKRERYRYVGAAGPDEIESESALLALNQARMITGNASLNRLEKWDGKRWVAMTQDQMVLGADGKANLKGAYGSASAKTAKVAMTAGTIPEHIAGRIKQAVDHLHELHTEMQAQRRAGSAEDWWRDHGGGQAVRQKMELVDKFRAAAPKGFDADAHIASLGGVPDFSDRSHQSAPINAVSAYSGDGLEARGGDAGAEAKHFYVSAIDGSKRHLVAGPYASHEDAKGMVDHVRKHADYDPRAHFMAWGTAGSATPLKTPLGENWKPAAPVDLDAIDTPAKFLEAVKKHAAARRDLDKLTLYGEERMGVKDKARVARLRARIADLQSRMDSRTYETKGTPAFGGSRP